MTGSTTNELVAVWGSSSSDVFAVGFGGVILHYDGNAWSTMTSDPFKFYERVWGNSPSDVFAVGFDGTIMHYDGNAWSNVASGTSNPLGGIWGSSSSDVFVVGSDGVILIMMAMPEHDD